MRTTTGLTALLSAALLGAAGFFGQAAGAAVVSGSAAAVPATTPSASHPCGTEAKPATIKHVIFIFLENHSYGAILGSSAAPYFNTLAKDCGIATNYHNITHPSLPNYIAATSGLSLTSLHKFISDCSPSGSCDTSVQSIFGQGESWRSYEETMPSGCDHANSGNYAVRHNPAAYYTALHACSGDDVPYWHLASDLAHNALPAFSFITPNLIDDMHNGTVADGNSWMSKNLPAILNSAEYKNGSTVIFITFDEGSDVGSYADGENCATNTSDTSCHLPTFVISPSVKVGARNGTLFNHYSLLGTAEQLLHLSKLGLAAKYPTMVSAFNL
jgi:phosphatidylinositol-3-phosphatase